MGDMSQLEGLGVGDSDDVDEWAAEAARYSAQGGFQEFELECVGVQRGGRQGRGRSAGLPGGPGRDSGVGGRTDHGDGEAGRGEGSGGEDMLDMAGMIPGVADFC